MAGKKTSTLVIIGLAVLGVTVTGVLGVLAILFAVPPVKLADTEPPAFRMPAAEIDLEHEPTELEAVQSSETSSTSNVPTDRTKEMEEDDLSLEHILSVAQSVAEGKLPHERLIELMKHPDPSVQANAAIAWSRTCQDTFFTLNSSLMPDLTQFDEFWERAEPDKDYIAVAFREALIVSVNDGSSDYLANVMGGHLSHDEEVLDMLVWFSNNHPDASQREDSMRQVVIRSRGGSHSAEVLRNRLRDSDWEVRLNALFMVPDHVFRGRF